MMRKERLMTDMGRKDLKICTMVEETLLTHFQGEGFWCVTCALISSKPGWPHGCHLTF